MSVNLMAFLTSFTAQNNIERIKLRKLCYAFLKKVRTSNKQRVNPSNSEHEHVCTSVCVCACVCQNQNEMHGIRILQTKSHTHKHMSLFPNAYKLSSISTYIK